MCIFVPKDEIPGGTFMKKFCIAALAATLALGTMITAQAADTTDGTVVSGTYKRSTNGGRRRGLKSPAGGAWEKLSDGTYKYHFAEGLEATDYWLEIDGTWYYFGHDNIMQTGWVKDDATGTTWTLRPALSSPAGTRSAASGTTSTRKAMASRALSW